MSTVKMNSIPAASNNLLWYIATEESRLAVSGTGEIIILNTGGSSASEGGMGSGSDNDAEKGELSKPGEKNSNATESKEDPDAPFDPIGKNIREKEKSNDQ